MHRLKQDQYRHKMLDRGPDDRRNSNQTTGVRSNGFCESVLFHETTTKIPFRGPLSDGVVDLAKNVSTNSITK